MFLPLAYGEDGAAFPVQIRNQEDDPAGWIVHRKKEEVTHADGSKASTRGRTALVHTKHGKPLILPLDATHADLFAAAGPGKYRLIIVDKMNQKVEGVPAAHTGMLAGSLDDSDDEYTDEAELMDEQVVPASTRRGPALERVALQTVNANTRIAERMLDQLGTVLNGVSLILQTAHSVGMLEAPPAAPAAEPPPPAPAEVPPSALEQAAQMFITMLPTLLTNLRPKGAPPVSSRRPPIATSSRATAASSSPVAPPTPADAAPGTSPGAASAEDGPHDDAPSDDEMTAQLGDHLQAVLAELTPQEAMRAVQLASQLTDDERQAWLARLATMTVPEAVAYARSLLTGPTPIVAPPSLADRS